MPARLQAGMGCLNHWIPACAGMTKTCKTRGEISPGISASGVTGMVVRIPTFPGVCSHNHALR